MCGKGCCFNAPKVALSAASVVFRIAIHGFPPQTFARHTKAVIVAWNRSKVTNDHDHSAGRRAPFSGS